MFYRPGRSFRYQHIDALFTGTIDPWDLIAAHADDMFQVALSIRRGASCHRCCCANSLFYR